MADEESGELSRPVERGAQLGRRRFARVASLLLVIGGVVLLLDQWRGRSVEAELVHQFPDGDAFLPADVEVQLWDGDYLLADAWFSQPESLEALRHTVRAPAGEYLVTLAIIREFTGGAELRYDQSVTIEDEGTYFLYYTLPEPQTEF